jgi:6-phosphogluconolactonase
MLKRLLGVVSALTLCLVLAQSTVFAADVDQGAVYTMTNDPAGNAVLMFSRASDGSLTPAGTFFTGGLGTGGKEPDFGLLNARPLVLNENNSLLLAVNPGSDDLSVFEVEPDALKLVDRHSSGGRRPVSVAVHGKLVYVLNAGGNDGGIDNVTGFTVSQTGNLRPLPDSTRPLSAAATGPAEVRFSRDGAFLAVTEPFTDKIDTYVVGNDGLLTGPVVNNSGTGTFPIGFDFGVRDEIFVADDFSDAIGAGAMSAYYFAADGSLHPVGGPVLAQQSGACWVLVSANGRYVYLANTVSSEITLYNVNLANGQITRLQSFPSPTNETDMDFTRDGRFLYALAPDETGSTPGINAYAVNPATGALTALPGVSGLPATVDGIAAR